MVSRRRRNAQSCSQKTSRTCAIFVGFLYTGLIYSEKAGDKTAYPDAEKGRLRDLWALGEKLLAVEFKDAVIDALEERIRSTNACPTDLCKTVYSRSASPSGMRRLYVDIATWGFGSDKDHPASIMTMETRSPATERCSGAEDQVSELAAFERVWEGDDPL